MIKIICVIHFVETPPNSKHPSDKNFNSIGFYIGYDIF